MSLFSRFFGKAPLPSSAPEKPSENADAVEPAPNLPDRAVVAAREEQALEAAIAGHEGEAIARLVIAGSSTKIRQQAAQAVDDPLRLRQLIRDVRGGNDKSVYKILTHKRDALLVRARELEQLRAEISAVAGALERHSHRIYDPLFTATLDQLESRWKTVAADAGADVVQSVQQAIDRSREVIAQHLRQIALEAAREMAVANAAAEAKRLRETEEKAAAIAAAEQAQILEAQHKAQVEKQEAEALALRQLGGLIRKARDALNDGSTGRAAGLRRTIEAKLPATPPLPPYVANQLQQLDTKLDDLKDWKSFSVLPKRAELLEEMESLSGATLEPVTLAERIKSLQAQWRTLSKGAGENLDTDWERFQEAARHAYEPCREYFEAQALLRRENLQRRAALLERLAAFEAAHNWEQPDWRTVTTALRESRQEWRQYSPVDRAAGKVSQERFVAVTMRLQGRLDAEYTRNVEQKGVLVERARLLIAGADSRQAIDAVKELQQKWKAVGPVPRVEDQRLWAEFRQHCDSVFQKRQQEFTDYAAALEVNKSRAITSCEALEKVAALAGPDLLEKARTIPDLRAEFEAVGELPKASTREIRGRFERAVERCEKVVARERARAAERSWTDLFDAANRVRAYKLAIALNVDAAEQGVLKRAVEDYVASVGQWPKGGLEAMKRALAKEGAHDTAANEVSLRKLCIRAEILTDRPTPPEDQQLRREYQVQRLMQSMGQGITADGAQLDTLALEWIGVGAVEEAAYAQLLTRFKRCRAH